MLRWSTEGHIKAHEAKYNRVALFAAQLTGGAVGIDVLVRLMTTSVVAVAAMTTAATMAGAAAMGIASRATTRMAKFADELEPPCSRSFRCSHLTSWV